MMRRGLLTMMLCVSASACSGASDGDGIGPVNDDVGDTSTSESAIGLDTSVASDGKTDTDTDASKPDTRATDADAEVGHPDAATTACQAELVALGISFKTTSARGVVDAVKLTGATINGVLFANGTDTTPMGDPMACEFAKTLHAFAGLLKTKGFVRIGTLGSYCYRCCCAWSTTNYCRSLTDPEPDCSASGYSTHSWGRAVDVRYLYKADGTRYDINDPTHWVKYTSTDTCGRGLTAQPAGSISRELYELACAATKNRIFGTVLTPNYNDVHRNHLHMDIGQTGTPTSFNTMDLAHGSPLPGIDDLPQTGDHCGDE
jgi:hypothetical protein